MIDRKYEMLDSIQTMIMELEGYKTNDLMYANLTGRMASILLTAQVEALYNDLVDEIQQKNIQQDLAYERAVGK